FTSNYELLLIATGENPGRKISIRRSDIELGDHSLCLGSDGSLVEKAQALPRNGREVMSSENRIVSEIEIEQQAATVTILWHVCNSELFEPSRSQSRAILSI